MGGFISRGLFELGEKAVNKIGQNTAWGEGAKKLANKAFGLDSTLTGESGKFLSSTLRKYESTADGFIAAGVKQVQATGQNIPRHVIETQARKLARNRTFGNNDDLLVGAIEAIRKEHGEEKARVVADNLGIYFHEQQPIADATGASRTRLITNLSRKSADTSDIGFRNSRYKGREYDAMTGDPGLEAKAHAIASSALAFKAGLAHTTTPLNLLMGNSLKNFLKGSTHLFGSGYDAARAEMQFYNAVGSLSLEELDHMQKFRAGIISKYAPGSIGEFIHQNISIPGFTLLRQRALTWAAMTGKYSAIENAANAISQDPDIARKAAIDLKWMDINVRDVINQGGKLTNEQIRQAMFSETQQKIGTWNGRNRSYFATANAFGRTLSMFHNYGAMQSTLIQNEIQKAIEKKDLVGLAKTFAIIGMVFPSAGIAVHGLEAVWNAHNPEEVLEDVKKQEKALFTSPALKERIEGIANVAGFGVLTSYARATSRYKLLSAMSGPIANAGVELAQDTAKAVVGHEKDREKGPNQVKSWEPLARDVLHDIPSLGIGGFIARRYLPNQQELNKRRPMTSKRLKAKRAAELRKLKQKAIAEGDK